MRYTKIILEKEKKCFWKMKREKVSTAVIRRLPRYYRNLEDLSLAGTVRISSKALSAAMGITASQIRQDLSCFGEFGLQGYGYNVENLRQEIGEILGVNQGHRAVLLGAGNLGRALMENFRFERCGFTLEVAFDADPDLIGTDLAGIPVLDVAELETYLKTHRTDVAVLTVPGPAAQGLADRLAQAGVGGIWNFTNMELAVPETTVVENVHFADSLLTLSYMIAKG